MTDGTISLFVWGFFLFFCFLGGGVVLIKKGPFFVFSFGGGGTRCETFMHFKRDWLRINVYKCVRC